MSMYQWQTGDRITATRLNSIYNLLSGAAGGTDTIRLSAGSVLNMSSASVSNAFLPPAAAGAAPVTEGVVAFDSTEDTLVWGNGTSTVKASQNPMTAAGDLIWGGAAGTPTRLAVGTAYQALQVSSAAASVVWGTPMAWLISSTTLGTTAASIDFASIPQQFKHLDIRLQARGNQAASNVSLMMKFNGSTAASYYDQGQYSTGASVAANSYQGTSAMVMGFIPAASSSRASNSAQLEIHVDNYSGAVLDKTAIAYNGMARGTGAGDNFVGIRAGFWASTAAITQVTLLPDLGKFSSGTVASLYGLL